MKHFLSIILLAALSVSANAIELSKNVDINGGVNLASSYIFRADHMAGISFQPFTGVTFHGDKTDWGSVNTGVWLGISEHPVELYRELDVSCTFTSPGNYVSVGATYFNYMGFSDWGNQVEMSIVGNLNAIPLSIGWYTMVYNECDPDNTYSTYLSLMYVADLGSDWKLSAEAGITFGLNGKSVGYVGDLYEIDYDNLQTVYFKNLSVSVDKYWQVHKDVGVYVNGTAALNLWDVRQRKFEYGKNINVGIGVGFCF